MAEDKHRGYRDEGVDLLTLHSPSLRCLWIACLVQAEALFGDDEDEEELFGGE